MPAEKNQKIRRLPNEHVGVRSHDAWSESKKELWSASGKRSWPADSVRSEQAHACEVARRVEQVQHKGRGVEPASEATPVVMIRIKDGEEGVRLRLGVRIGRLVSLG